MKKKAYAFFEKLQEDGQLTVILKSSVKSILANSVQLETTDGLRTLRNDAVVVCAGGIVPTGFLKTIGVEIETKYGLA